MKRCAHTFAVSKEHARFATESAKLGGPVSSSVPGGLDLRLGGDTSDAHFGLVECVNIAETKLPEPIDDFPFGMTRIVLGGKGIEPGQFQFAHRAWTHFSLSPDRLRPQPRDAMGTLVDPEQP